MSTLNICLEGSRWTCSRVESVLNNYNFDWLFMLWEFHCLFFMFRFSSCSLLGFKLCFLSTDCSDSDFESWQCMFAVQQVPMIHRSHLTCLVRKRTNCQDTLFMARAKPRTHFFRRMARAKPRTHFFRIWLGLTPLRSPSMARAKPRTHFSIFMAGPKPSTPLRYFHHGQAKPRTPLRYFRNGQA